MKNLQNTCFLLDLDGLLLDSLSVWAEIDTISLKKHGVFSPENLAGFSSCSTIADAASYIRTLGVHISDADFIEEITNLLSEKYRKELPLMPGAKEFLQKNASHPMALMTASPEDLVAPALERLGIRQFFDCLICDVDKHLPSVFSETLRMLCWRAGNTILYDDSDWAREAAQSVGIQTRASIALATAAQPEK